MCGVKRTQIKFFKHHQGNPPRYCTHRPFSAVSIRVRGRGRCCCSVAGIKNTAASPRATGQRPRTTEAETRATTPATGGVACSLPLCVLSAWCARHGTGTTFTKISTCGHRTDGSHLCPNQTTPSHSPARRTWVDKRDHCPARSTRLAPSAPTALRSKYSPGKESASTEPLPAMPRAGLEAARQSTHRMQAAQPSPSAQPGAHHSLASPGERNRAGAQQAEP